MNPWEKGKPIVASLTIRSMKRGEKTGRVLKMCRKRKIRMPRWQAHRREGRIRVACEHGGPSEKKLERIDSKRERIALILTLAKDGSTALSFFRRRGDAHTKQ